MKINNRDFFKVIERHLEDDAAVTVVAIIDEQPGMFDHARVARGVQKEPALTQERFQQRWSLVTNYQLRILSMAAKTGCRFCEINFGPAPSTEQIRAILTGVEESRRVRFLKQGANALQDREILSYVVESPEFWIVMGYDVDACVAATCGVSPELAEKGDKQQSEHWGLLQFDKRILTADVVLHPSPPNEEGRWRQLGKYGRLQFFFDPIAKQA